MTLLINKPLKFILKLLGLWPYNFNIFGPLILASSIVTTLPFQLWYALISSENPVMLMDGLSDMFAQTIILIKIFIMWKNKRLINGLLKDVLNDWKVKKLPANWKSISRTCTLFCRVVITMYATATTVYFPDLVLSYFGQPKEHRKLFFASKYPFDYHSSPIYEIVILVQIIQCLLIVAADLVSQTLLAALILHASAHMALFKVYLRVYSDSIVSSRKLHGGYRCDKDNFMFLLKRIVKQHVKILDIVDRIDAVYSFVSLFQLLFSNVIICVTGYVLITAVNLTNMLYLIKFLMFILVMFLQAFTFCFAGQYLRNQGESLVHAVYDCEWYAGTPQEVRMLSLILFKTQNPLTLSGGKLFELSANSFTMIVKTSLSYLSVLRAVYA
ncbi:odorant receptor 13a-like [Phymastichus coffea]|uniref:odorant receptor 13a-like n=1 Tax=Phymastichus coffea TaxID=108790 RepID=UPI00273CA145|nr:odorant receptor 13a-like [Phymastichus coffea]